MTRVSWCIRMLNDQCETNKCTTLHARPKTKTRLYRTNPNKHAQRRHGNGTDFIRTQ